jgi:stringent starvation protein B
MVSTKPYLLRAIFQWCVDQGLTPYIAVVVDPATRVPAQYVKDGQITLNISPEAAHQLVMGDDTITCSARFGGIAQTLVIPVNNVAAIYARENGHGMAFDVIEGHQPDPECPAGDEPPRPEPSPPSDKSSGSRSHLTRIK